MTAATTAEPGQCRADKEAAGHGEVSPSPAGSRVSRSSQPGPGPLHDALHPPAMPLVPRGCPSPHDVLHPCCDAQVPRWC